MDKKNVLIKGNKRSFIELFKNKFLNDFEFYESSFTGIYLRGTEEGKNFVFVAYDKVELIEFLKKDSIGCDLLVCLFDKVIENDFLFLEKIRSLIILNECKSINVITEVLKLCGHNNIENVQYSESRYLDVHLFKNQLNDDKKTFFWFRNLNVA